MKANIDISIGELLDRISILLIKSVKILDPDKVKWVHMELEDAKYIATELNVLNISYICRLYEVNSRIWEVEESIRVKETLKNYGSTFISFARNVYLFNDERYSIKKEIDEEYESDIREQKGHGGL